jgi:hypothetical protein
MWGGCRARLSIVTDFHSTNPQFRRASVRGKKRGRVFAQSYCAPENTADIFDIVSAEPNDHLGAVVA